MRKKAIERFGETRKLKGQDESDTSDKKNQAEDVVHKWLVFFEKDLYKIVNSHQKTLKMNKMKGKFGNDTIPSSLYKINKCKLSKAWQSKPCCNSRFRSWFCSCKDSKVVHFNWTVLGFVSTTVLCSQQNSVS